MGYFSKSLIFLALYWLSAQIGLLFPEPFYIVTPMWPPAGVALAVLFIGGLKYVPSVLLGAILANSLGTELSPGFVGIVSLGSTAASALLVYLLQKHGFDRRLNSVSSVRLLVLSVALAAAAAASCGSLAIFVFGAVDEIGFFRVFLTWWVGDAMGALLVGSLIFSWLDREPSTLSRRLELLVLVAGAFVVSSLCFYNDTLPWTERLQLSFVIFPSIVWAALRFGARGTTLVTVLVGTVAIFGTVMGYGLFNLDTTGQSLLLLQFYLVVIGLTGLFLSASAREAAEMEKGLRSANRELKDAIEAVRVTASEARKANQMKSEFMAMVSHEMRTPLNGVVGFTDLLLTSDLEPGQREEIEMIRSSGQSLISLVDEILELNKVDSGHLDLSEVPFSLSRLIKEVVELQNFKAAEKALPIEVIIAADVPDSLLGDVQRLRQILNNLVGNAVKFTERGQVTVRVRRDPVSGENERTALLVFSVQDTGIGIADEEMERLFQPFSQANPSISNEFGGSGLGLAITKNICEAMRGCIWVESEVGKGSTFFVSLAFTEVSPDEVIDNLRQNDALLNYAAATPAESLDIIVAEDDPASQRVMKQVLQRMNHRVEIVVDRLDLVQSLERNNQFDVVLVDLEMPRMDGYEAARVIRSGRFGQRLVNAPIIAVTAYSMVEDRRKAKEAGITEHLAKPFNFEKLGRILSGISKDKLQRRQEAEDYIKEH